MPDYTKLTNLEVTGHLKVAGQEVPPGGGGARITASHGTASEIRQNIKEGLQ